MPLDDSLKQVEQNQANLSIGAVSKATGIPTETLRTWERRYGFPLPQRTDSGHRKYTEQTVQRLVLVNRALEKGMRPGDVLPKEIKELHALLDITESARYAPKQLATLQPHSDVTLMSHVTISTVDGWMKHLVALDEEALQESFKHNWFRLGPVTFLTQLIAPLLGEIGMAWYEGRIAVIHEQFASNQLRTFLSTQWRDISKRNSGPHVICASLPGEFHAIGLHMIAVIMAITGRQITFLGCDAPIDTILHTAEHTRATAVLISVSEAANTSQSTQQLDVLRKRLPRDVSLVVGGQGAPRGLEGLLCMETLGDLERWASHHELRTTQ